MHDSDLTVSIVKVILCFHTISFKCLAMDGHNAPGRPEYNAMAAITSVTVPCMESHEVVF